MEFNINGIIYFDKQKTTTSSFTNDIYELDEYKVLKKWLIFKQKPKSLEEIKILELQVDLFIKINIKNLEYKFNNIDISDLNIDTSNIKKNVPECFYRCKQLLSGVVEL